MLDPRLNIFISEQSEHLAGLYTSIESNRERVFARTIKLSEEVGELAEAVLASESLQRKSKSSKEVSLEQELCDVIITALLLAKSLDIDMDQALSARVEKIRSRRSTD